MEQTTCLFFPAPTPLEPLAEACFRFTSRIALRKDRAIFLETGKSRLLYSAENLAARIQALCRRFALDPRLTMAADAATALALARHGETRPGQLPLEALVDYADPFRPSADLQKKIQGMVLSLRQLGLSRLEEFLNLPPAQLGSRFPAEAAQLWHRLRNGEVHPWPLFVPELKVMESADLRDLESGAGCENVEALSFHLKVLADRALSRLRGRGLRLAALELVLKLEARGGEPLTRRLLLRLPLPQGSSLGLMRLLRDALAQEFGRRPLPSPAQGLELKVLDTAPLLDLQSDLFTRREEQREAWASLVDRLSQKLGPQKVYVAESVERYLPEASWKKGMREWEGVRNAECGMRQTLPGSANRPLLLLPRPQLLLKKEDQLFGHEGKSWKVLEAEGPERLNGEWWLDDKVAGFQRDYFRVTTGSGQHLWIFCTSLKEPLPFLEREESFYLHGYFD